jgi:hypothetical protein
MAVTQEKLRNSLWQKTGELAAYQELNCRKIAITLIDRDLAKQCLGVSAPE